MTYMEAIIALSLFSVKRPRAQITEKQADKEIHDATMGNDNAAKENGGRPRKIKIIRKNDLLLETNGTN